MRVDVSVTLHASRSMSTEKNACYLASDRVTGLPIATCLRHMGVLQSLRIEGSHLSEFPEFWGAPICTNLKMEEAPICPNYF